MDLIALTSDERNTKTKSPSAWAAFVRVNLDISGLLSAKRVSFIDASTSCDVSDPDWSFASHLEHSTPDFASKEQMSDFTGNKLLQMKYSDIYPNCNQANPIIAQRGCLSIAARPKIGCF